MSKNMTQIDRHADLLKRRAKAQALANAKIAKRGAPKTTLSEETRAKVATLAAANAQLPSEKAAAAEEAQNPPETPAKKKK